VPDVTGLDQASAIDEIINAGLTVGPVVERANRRFPAGQVIRTAPAAGREVEPGAVIRIIVSSGPPGGETAAPSPSPVVSFPPSPSPVPSAPPSEVPSAVPSAVPSGSPIAGSHLAAVQAAGVLRVNVSPDDPPWSRVTDNGDPGGFEVQLARRIARELGVDVTFTTDPASVVLDGSDLGGWDIALNHLPSIDPVTASFVLSEPYAWDPLAVAVAGANADVPADLTGLSVCVRSGSAEEAWLNGAITLTDGDGNPVAPPAVTTLPVASDADCATSLAGGVAQAWIAGRPTLAAGDSADQPLTVGDATLAGVPVAAAVEPAGSTDTSLVDAVDAAIAALRDSGQLARFSQRAFDADLTTGPPPIGGTSPGASPSPFALIDPEARS
jgi:ABC-type amino acid transport substrate-binding protein